MSYGRYLYGGDFDTLSGSPVAVELEHNKIHRGFHFEQSDYTVAAASATNFRILRVSAAAKNPHLTFDVTGDLGFVVKLYEANTTTAITTTASAITAYNNNREDGTAATMNIYSGLTATVVTASVSQIYVQPIGAAALPSNAKPTASNRANEFVLAKGKDYLFEIGPYSASTTVGWVFSWYEV